MKKIRKKIIFICGSIYQSKIMLEISKNLHPTYDCFFSPMYADGILKLLSYFKLTDCTDISGYNREATLYYLKEKKIPIDDGAKRHNYDLVVTCSDLIIQKNIRNKPIILVQEGMTDPENFIFTLVKYLKLPRWLASTASFGLSNQYQKFCVASEGYKHFFTKKGVKPEKISVTGLPTYDNLQKYKKNNFPHKKHVLVVTSDMRETFKFDNRKKFINHCKQIAQNKKIIFKLHPKEDILRAIKEIERMIPNALIFQNGNLEEMIANCSTLITQYSTAVYMGLALGKECYSYYDIEQLKTLTPIQNNGTCAKKIADVCEGYLQ